MTNMMEYNGYAGIVEFSSEDGVFFGKLFGINDLVTFEGASVKELEKAFRDAVDDYLNTCEELGKDPERAYKGSFNVRINPEIHRRAAFKAQALHISLNELVEKAIAREVEPREVEHSVNLKQRKAPGKSLSRTHKRETRRPSPTKKK